MIKPCHVLKRCSHVRRTVPAWILQVSMTFACERNRRVAKCWQWEDRRVRPLDTSERVENRRRQWITVTAGNNDSHITKTRVIIISTIIATLDWQVHVFAAAKATGGKKKGKHIRRTCFRAARGKERGSKKILLFAGRALRSRFWRFRAPAAIVEL